MIDPLSGILAFLGLLFNECSKKREASTMQRNVTEKEIKKETSQSQSGKDNNDKYKTEFERRYGL